MSATIVKTRLQKLLSKFSIKLLFSFVPPDLPKHQDCHELWSKRRKKQIRDGSIPPPQVSEESPYTSQHYESACSYTRYSADAIFSLAFPERSV